MSLVAMNLTEMESKVREATNNEPWGAPSTLMAQIAGGTYNYREREEIIAFIFRRFTEKAANEWRQIYKSLQLLEYLIRNGSERIIDDIRGNLSLIQMLKSFHYIDSKGRDQGINVRNRAKTLIALLNDDAMIRSERKKARATAKKFGGVSSNAYGGSSYASGELGFDDDEDFTNRVYGDGGVYGARYGDSAEEYKNGQTGRNNDNFEEYNIAPSKSSSKPTTESSKVTATSKKPSQEPDLLGDLMSFDTQPTSSTSAPTAAPVNEEDDDEFDDFQAAPSPATAPAPSLSQNLSSLYHTQPATYSPSVQQQPQIQQNLFNQPAQQSYFNAPPPPISKDASYNSGTTSSAPSKSNNDAFSSLFSSAKSKTAPKPVSQTSTGKSNQTTPSYQQPAPSSSNNQSTSTSNNQNGEIDLLSF